MLDSLKSSEALKDSHFEVGIVTTVDRRRNRGSERLSTLFFVMELISGRTWIEHKPGSSIHIFLNILLLFSNESIEHYNSMHS